MGYATHAPAPTSERRALASSEMSQSDSPTLRVVTLNAGSLLEPDWKNRRHEIVSWLDHLRPDVVCLQEVWEAPGKTNTSRWIAEQSDTEWHVAVGVRPFGAEVLDDPTLWSPPQRLVEGGSWYPQVMGIEAGTGTDKEAGARARFFMGGTSTSLIEFLPPSRR